MPDKPFVRLAWATFGLYALTAFGQDMPHERLNRPCKDCHEESNWYTIHFDHQQTDYWLVEKHQGVPCLLCHDIKDFQEVEIVCSGCHEDVHQEKLGKQCEQCHSPSGWEVFDVSRAHARTTFPLIGAHSRLDCRACHVGEIEGEFTMLQSACFACHGELYRQTQNPVHTEMGFSLKCDECHSMFDWHSADFSKHESFFPIFSGAHAGRWQNCTTCHFQAGNYREFSCYLNCHEHNKSSTDGHHREVRGYQYDSHFCYSCHPGGKGGD